MLVRDIPISSLPSLQPLNTVSEALDTLQEYACEQLPVVEDGIFLGMIQLGLLSEHSSSDQLLQSFLPLLPPPAIQPEHHFLQALSFASDHALTVIPVRGVDGEFAGVITLASLLKELTRFLGLHQGGGLLVLERDIRQFSFSEVSKIVESNDAFITQLNTAHHAQTGLIQITLRINKSEISDIMAAFQRYDYQVCFFAGEEQYSNQLRTHYDHLMHYLKI